MLHTKTTYVEPTRQSNGFTSRFESISLRPSANITLNCSITSRAVCISLLSVSADESSSICGTRVFAALPSLQASCGEGAKTFFRSAFYGFCVNLFGINFAQSLPAL